ncbi:MAG: 1-acyl-sn-glycerol-3-phosphate acyltransferase [Burkholderiaceae bacterium]|jgi:1-acyl-sn-glycerol-3-phosphate acyltransferase|nr:1-acyl-sn-glycerol-3-phosphate acyltransferase [Burkholderiaceae bacterium]
MKKHPLRSLWALFRALRAVARFVHALGHSIRGWWIIRMRFSRYSQPVRNKMVQAWAERMLNIMGIRLEVQGTPPNQGPALVVANHTSWLDIVTLHAARHVRFISKAGVRHWPLISTLSDGAGTLYIERERRKDALRMMHHMADALRAGDLIAVFPEGAIGDNVTLQPFHANLLQAAIAAGAPVQPVALRFADAASGQTSFAPSYFKASLLRSFWRTLCAPPLVAHVNFGTPQSSEGRTRGLWANELHAQVQALRQQTHRGADK